MSDASIPTHLIPGPLHPGYGADNILDADSEPTQSSGEPHYKLLPPSWYYNWVFEEQFPCTGLLALSHIHHFHLVLECRCACPAWWLNGPITLSSQWATQLPGNGPGSSIEVSHRPSTAGGIYSIPKGGSYLQRMAEICSKILRNCTDLFWGPKEPPTWNVSRRPLDLPVHVVLVAGQQALWPGPFARSISWFWAPVQRCFGVIWKVSGIIHLDEGIFLPQKIQRAPETLCLFFGCRRDQMQPPILPQNRYLD